MKKAVALLCVTALCSSGVVACTPKPPSVEPVAEEVFTALEEGDTESLDGLVDNAETTQQIFKESYDGLQAEGVDFELAGVNSHDPSYATVDYSVTWTLPRDRQLQYDTQMALTKSNDEWTVRWQPSMIHPKLGANQHLELRAIEAERAGVVSSDGVELLKPGTEFRLLVDGEKTSSPRGLAARIADAVSRAKAEDETVGDIDAKELAKTLEDNTGTYSVGMYSEAAGKILQEELAGVDAVRLNEEPALVTKDPGFAPDIMSRVRSLVQDDVDGNNGWSVSVVNEHGAALSDVERHAPEPAPALKVGIDYDVQRAAQEAVDARAGQEAMMVAIRPSTGEILAVAQTPEADKKGDLALQGQYPPGSVFKIITAGAGVDHQGLDPSTIVPCPGTMDIYGRVVTNYNSFALGDVPLERAFAQSCNTTFADISTKLAPGELKDMSKAFGLGIDYEVPGLNTITGSVPVGEEPLERTEAGYGQGHDLASPFGMALVSATVAAGKRPVPTLLAGRETKASEDVNGPTPEVIEKLRQMMRATVTNGTASGMQAGGEIHGKTGEAEINEGSHAWFTGYRADDDIAFATLVVLGGGSEVSVAMTDSFFQKLDQYRAEPEPDTPAAPAEN